MAIQIFTIFISLKENVKNRAFKLNYASCHFWTQLQQKP